MITWALPIYAVCSLTSMAGMNLGFLFLTLALLMTWLQNRSKKVPVPQDAALALASYRFWASILFLACVVSLLAAQFFPFAYAGHIPDITWHGYQKSWYLLCPFIVFWTFRFSLDRLEDAPETFERTLKFWWITLLGLLVMALIQFFTGWPLRMPLPGKPGFYHTILLMGHHLSVSSILIFPTFTALAIALGAYSRKKQLLRLEWLAGMSGILILFLTWARTSWLAIPIGFILLFTRYFDRRKLWASIAALAIVLATVSQTPIVKDRIEANVGIRDRITLWKANIDFFKNRPITGIGWLKTQEMSEFYFKEKNPTGYREYFWGHAHSNFFEMLGGTGLIGLLGFLGWSFFTFALAYQTTRRAKEAGLDRWADFSWGLFVALVLLHFNGLTNVTFWEGKVMHQQMLAVGFLLILQLWIPRAKI